MVVGCCRELSRVVESYRELSRVVGRCRALWVRYGRLVMFDDEFFDMAIQAGGHDEGIESGMEVCDWKLVSGSMEIKG